MEEKIILYSTGCPMCRALTRQLDAKGIKYTVESDIERMKELGLMSVPALEIDGKRLDFTDAMAWVRSK